jgi:iron complex transport system substrate-binding protein
MRIVSLLPSATEVLFALGFDREIVGVSHECDFPSRAKTKTAVVRSRLPHDASPSEIDRLVGDYVERGESLYAVDAELLEGLAPDLIVTQDLCQVCAASRDDLAAVVARFRRRPEILCLNPQNLGDVWRDVLWMGEETLRFPRAQELLEKAGERLGEVQQEMGAQSNRPRVVLLEWLQPLYVGGHWVPEMIQFSGGTDVLGAPDRPSRRVTVEEVIDAAPDILLIAPCGYRKEQASAEYLSLLMPDRWRSIPAVRAGRVYALDANSYVSRPSLRLVTGIAAMAKAIHPTMKCQGKVLSTMQQIVEKERNFQTASA